MRKLMLLAGVAAFAVAAPALAKGQGHGGGGHGGHGGNGGHAAQPHHGGGGQGHGVHGGSHAARGHGPQRHGGQANAHRQRGPQRLDARQRRVERAIEHERRDLRQARQEQRFDTRRRVEQRLARDIVREDRRDWRRWSERRLALRDRFEERRFERGRRLAIGSGGCPPGLARQNRFCMPPGQLRKAQLIGRHVPFSNLAYNVPDRFRYRFSDGGRWLYRYDDAGFVYRIDRRSSLVNSIYPLFGNSLTMGEPLPLGYEVYNVPLSYRRFYPDTSNYFYRYDDGAIYRVNSQTNLVDGIVAMLTGGVGGLGSLGVGDPLPTGYDAYNVPLDYRDRYADTGDSWYRYADGSIYQVDPQTRLIQAVISLLV
ncbi:MAG TPA: hypothetical protein VGX37_03650 [Allosphingosinicella sp.]|jgi:hypothetical protein|nr:hypothetical protein [Allosphingosinicella sp.]